MADDQRETKPKQPAPAGDRPTWEPYAKRIAAVRAREASMRDASCFRLPSKVGPFTVRQMLPRDALLFYATANPVFAGLAPFRCSLATIAAFLWLLRPAGCADHASAWDMPSRWFLKARLVFLFARSRKAWARMLTELARYQQETFLDWPRGGGSGSGGGGAGVGLRPSFLSSIFHRLAATYHWSLADLYATPIRELLVYYKHVRADLEAKAGQTMVDASTAELAIKAEYMEAVAQWEAAHKKPAPDL